MLPRKGTKDDPLELAEIYSLLVVTEYKTCRSGCGVVITSPLGADERPTFGALFFVDAVFAR